MGLAEKSFLQALKMKEEYLPAESAAPVISDSVRQPSTGRTTNK